MPVSKKRSTRKPKPPGRRRDKQAEFRARDTQASQKAASSVKKLTPAAFLRRRILGWSLIVLGVIVLVTHVIEHLGFFSFASPGVQDIVAGYPMAGVLGVAGVIILSK